jgi:hypothetical protein
MAHSAASNKMLSFCHAHCREWHFSTVRGESVHWGKTEHAGMVGMTFMHSGHRLPIPAAPYSVVALFGPSEVAVSRNVAVAELEPFAQRAVTL